MAATWGDVTEFADHIAKALPDRAVTVENGCVVISRRSRRAAILAVAARLTNQPLSAMQPLADELVPLGIDVSGNQEHLRALSVLVTNLRHDMKPSEDALQALGCAA